MNIIKKIRKCKLFENLTTNEIETLFIKEDIYTKQIKEGEYFLFAGDILKNAVFCIKGSLKTEMIREEGKIMTMDKIKEGSMVAPAFIFSEKNYLPVDVIAATDTEVLYIEKEKFFKIIYSKEKLMKNFLKISSKKIEHISSKLSSTINKKTIREKLNNYIEEKRIGAIFKMEISLTKLAAIFLVERPSLSRVLSQYIKEGKLEKKDKNTYIVKIKN
ncbi:MAG: Crp/Fnr family transcriptional regulator [Fusobacteriaceae bacterium]